MQIRKVFYVRFSIASCHIENLEKAGRLLADLALVDAKVQTMIPSQPVVEAIAIKKDRIIKVGSNEKVGQFIGRRTRIVKLQGKTVFPGFIDAHVHVVDFGRFLMWLDLRGVESIAELQHRLSERVKKTRAGQWILGRGWNQTCFKEKRLPYLSEVDAASPSNPVILYHECDMICAVNSRGLELAGITASTVAPATGAIDKDPETGKPLGILRDTATDLAWKAVPEPSQDELLKATRLALNKMAETGLTSIHWLLSSDNEISTVKELKSSRNLPIRVYVIIPGNLLDEAAIVNIIGNPWLRIAGVMLSVDEYLASKTAALLRPYQNKPGYTGKLLSSQDELINATYRILEAGLQPVMHAVGDRAIDVALTVIERNTKSHSNTVRFRIEHGAVLNESLIDRMKKQQVIVSVQPRVMLSEFSVWSAIDSLGAQRARWLYPLKTLLGKGIRVIGGSDCPMEPLNPLLGMQNAVLREYFPEERLSIEQALRMYTVDAAYSTNEESSKGSIEAGKLADLTVLSGDPLTTDPNKISNISVEMTIVAGKIVFSKNTNHPDTD